jgi:RNA-directed DNA polymerase
MNIDVGAPSTRDIDWGNLDWSSLEKQVLRLQMRIAKATREGSYGKVKSLQWLLTHSFAAKCLAVRRVVRNRGGKTAGVDGVVWLSSSQKMEAVKSLSRRGYKTLPLRRIYIPKKQKGKFRPLSIPVMKCRAQQALHLLALEPTTENVVDKFSYGFRPKRSAADAIERCFNLLSNRTRAQYILEGDIKACFDTISHQWLLKNTPMDKEILAKWLSAGYMEDNNFHQSTKGTPQGGIISPTLLNFTLSGMTDAIKAAVTPRDKVNVCIYADDFIITGVNEEVLEYKVKPAVENFLATRGLSLALDKTKITHINEGFDFLGFNIRKYKGKLLIKPSKDSIKSILAKIREIIKSNKAVKAIDLIEMLNPVIRGWANYYRHVVSKKIFNRIDHLIFKSIWQWVNHRHPNKNCKWKISKYFRREEQRSWIFTARKTIASKQGIKQINKDLVNASDTKIRRHTIIQSAATPYDPSFKEYFDKRDARKKSRCNLKRLKHSDVRTKWLGHTYGF